MTLSVKVASWRRNPGPSNTLLECYDGDRKYLAEAEIYICIGCEDCNYCGGHEWWKEGRVVYESADEYYLQLHERLKAGDA